MCCAAQSHLLCHPLERSSHQPDDVRHGTVHESVLHRLLRRIRQHGQSQSPRLSTVQRHGHSRSWSRWRWRLRRWRWSIFRNGQHFNSQRHRNNSRDCCHSGSPASSLNPQRPTLHLPSPKTSHLRQPPFSYLS